MKKVKQVLFLLAIIFSLQTTAFSQCKTFTKNVCKPKLSPYIYNGQLNSAMLNEGDIAELMLTFYSNQDYRIVVCGTEELGVINFVLKDVNGDIIYSNSDHEMIDHWDFHTKSTQQLSIEVSVPVVSKEELSKSGCVSILVGFLDKK